MGTIITARCRCGFYSGDFHVGGGMMNFKEVCHAPAICEKCKNFLVANYLRKCARCPECGAEVTFYNEPRLRDQAEVSKGKPAVFSWNTGGGKGVFELPDAYYLCPGCGEKKMRFIEQGCWD